MSDQAREPQSYTICRDCFQAWPTESLRDGDHKLCDCSPTNVVYFFEVVEKSAFDAAVARVAELREGMTELGFIVGRNPDGVDDTVAATLLVVKDALARIAEVEAELARERDQEAPGSLAAIALGAHNAANAALAEHKTRDEAIRSNGYNMGWCEAEAEFKPRVAALEAAVVSFLNAARAVLGSGQEGEKQ